MTHNREAVMQLATNDTSSGAFVHSHHRSGRGASRMLSLVGAVAVMLAIAWAPPAQLRRVRHNGPLRMTRTETGSRSS